MIGLIESSKLVLALVGGVAVAMGLLVLIGVGARGRAPVWGAVAVVIVVITAGGAWAIITSSPTQPTVSSAPPPPPATCNPNGTSLQLTASKLSFSTTCLAAPAGQAFTITFHNDDPNVSHDVHILADDPTKDPNATSFFTGELVPGPATSVYHVDPIPAGNYFFRCDVHPTQMHGTFVVK